MRESWTEFLTLIAWTFAPFFVIIAIFIGLWHALGEIFMRLVERHERKNKGQA